MSELTPEQIAAQETLRDASGEIVDEFGPYLAEAMAEPEFAAEFRRAERESA